MLWIYKANFSQCHFIFSSSISKMKSIKLNIAICLFVAFFTSDSTDAGFIFNRPVTKSSGGVSAGGGGGVSVGGGGGVSVGGGGGRSDGDGGGWLFSGGGTTSSSGGGGGLFTGNLIVQILCSIFKFPILCDDGSSGNDTIKINVKFEFAISVSISTWFRNLDAYLNSFGAFLKKITQSGHATDTVSLQAAARAYSAVIALFDEKTFETKEDLNAALKSAQAQFQIMVTNLNKLKSGLNSDESDDLTALLSSLSNLNTSAGTVISQSIVVSIAIQFSFDLSAKGATALKSSGTILNNIWATLQLLISSTTITSKTAINKIEADFVAIINYLTLTTFKSEADLKSGLETNLVSNLNSIGAEIEVLIKSGTYKGQDLVNLQLILSLIASLKQPLSDVNVDGITVVGGTTSSGGSQTTSTPTNGNPTNTVVDSLCERFLIFCGNDSKPRNSSVTVKVSFGFSITDSVRSFFGEFNTFSNSLLQFLVNVYVAGTDVDEDSLNTIGDSFEALIELFDGVTFKTEDQLETAVDKAEALFQKILDVSAKFVLKLSAEQKQQYTSVTTSISQLIALAKSIQLNGNTSPSTGVTSTPGTSTISINIRFKLTTSESESVKTTQNLLIQLQTAFQLLFKSSISDKITLTRLETNFQAFLQLLIQVEFDTKDEYTAALSKSVTLINSIWSDISVLLKLSNLSSQDKTTLLNIQGYLYALIDVYAVFNVKGITVPKPDNNTPTTVSPTGETPRTGLPTRETSRTGLPTRETSRTGLPTRETSRTGLPTGETLRTDLPTRETPRTGLPTRETPSTGLPTRETPKTGTPTTPGSGSTSITIDFRASAALTLEIKSLNAITVQLTNAFKDLLNSGQITDKDQFNAIYSLYLSILAKLNVKYNSQEDLIQGLTIAWTSFLEVIAELKDFVNSSGVGNVAKVAINSIIAFFTQLSKIFEQIGVVSTGGGIIITFDVSKEENASITEINSGLSQLYNWTQNSEVENNQKFQEVIRLIAKFRASLTAVFKSKSDLVKVLTDDVVQVNDLIVILVDLRSSGKVTAQEEANIRIVVKILTSFSANFQVFNVGGILTKIRVAFQLTEAESNAINQTDTLGLKIWSTLRILLKNENIKNRETIQRIEANFTLIIQLFTQINFKTKEDYTAALTKTVTIINAIGAEIDVLIKSGDFKDKDLSLLVTLNGYIYALIDIYAVFDVDGIKITTSSTPVTTPKITTSGPNTPTKPTGTGPGSVTTSEPDSGIDINFDISSVLKAVVESVNILTAQIGKVLKGLLSSAEIIDKKAFQAIYSLYVEIIAKLNVVYNSEVELIKGVAIALSGIQQVVSKLSDFVESGVTGLAKITIQAVIGSFSQLLKLFTQLRGNKDVGIIVLFNATKEENDSIAEINSNLGKLFNWTETVKNDKTFTEIVSLVLKFRLSLTTVFNSKTDFVKTLTDDVNIINTIFSSIAKLTSSGSLTDQQKQYLTVVYNIFISFQATFKVFGVTGVITSPSNKVTIVIQFSASADVNQSVDLSNTILANIQDSLKDLKSTTVNDNSDVVEIVKEFDLIFKILGKTFTSLKSLKTAVTNATSTLEITIKNLDKLIKSGTIKDDNALTILKKIYTFSLNLKNSFDDIVYGDGSGSITIDFFNPIISIAIAAIDNVINSILVALKSVMDTLNVSLKDEFSVIYRFFLQIVIKLRTTVFKTEKELEAAFSVALDGFNDFLSKIEAFLGKVEGDVKVFLTNIVDFLGDLVKLIAKIIGPTPGGKTITIGFNTTEEKKTTIDRISSGFANLSLTIELLLKLNLNVQVKEQVTKLESIFKKINTTFTSKKFETEVELKQALKNSVEDINDAISIVLNLLTSGNLSDDAKNYLQSILLTLRIFARLFAVFDVTGIVSEEIKLNFDATAVVTDSVKSINAFISYGLQLINILLSRTDINDKTQIKAIETAFLKVVFELTSVVYVSLDALIKNIGDSVSDINSVIKLTDSLLVSGSFSTTVKFYLYSLVNVFISFNIPYGQLNVTGINTDIDYCPCTK